MLAKRIELGAFALLQLLLGAVDEAVDQRVQRRAIGYAPSRKNLDAIGEGLLQATLDQPQRTAPAEP